MRRLYDAGREALVYVGEAATAAFWDAQWSSSDEALGALLRHPPTGYVVWTTKRWLDRGAGPVLEGGCGRGQHVAALVQQGYACTGLDSAPETVAAIGRVAPHLDVRAGDVRALPFPDASFAGYWSIGVIEHFWEGYDAILSEAARVVRPGGFLFLVYPYMSPARRFRARVGGFPPCGAQAPEGFYQFALSRRRVRKDVEREGFTLRGHEARGGVLGLREELPGRQRRGRRQPRGAIGRLVEGAVSRALAPVFGHSILEIYQR